MKTSFTCKNRVTPQLLFLSSLVLLFSTNIFGSVKHTINVTNYKFAPNELQIEVGDTVEWKNTQGFHNVNGTKTTFPSNPESFGNSTGSGWIYKYVFKTAGNYDYHCDPHYEGGMVGKIEVKDSVVVDDKYNLTINFTGMTPHVGQNIYLSLTDKDSGIEIERKKQTGSVSFQVLFSGIEKDHSYNVDFFADHNKNGQYDAPSTDHAWRMELNNVMGDTTLMFQHNTSFTDIKWKNKLTVHFMGMNPHVGQNLQLAVIEKTSGMELQRVSVTAAVDFMVDVFGIENGKSYNIDFFADHNKNGAYDAPSTDHAWRMELNNVMGDTTLMFQHNTSFTDIKWKNKLTVHFMGMNPHVGQNLQLAVIEKTSGMELQRVSVTAAVDFMVDVFGIENGKSYNVDFFADHNKNGQYDAPPADHAWRMELNNVMGDTTLMFQHNTSFTDIKWKNKLTVHFMGMNPHVGQNLQLAVIEKTSGMELQRVSVTAAVDFMIDVFGIENGKSYNVDFFADHNKNGQYDAPSTDHAWRMELNNVMGDTTLMFQHNTSFTNINWKNKLTVHFMGMNPHVGQNLQLAVIEKTSGMELQRVSVTAAVDFMVDVFGIENGKSYNVDFFADHNKNGQYDAPPADHAWRMELNNVMGDTTLMFQHNTSFTNINWKNKLTVHFMGMNPHVGQNLQLAVIEKTSGMELQRVSVTAAVDFMVDVFGIENGKSYNVDFFADHNKNGQYDAPPADHAWRMELNNVMGDTTMMFQHNTSFTNINWKNKLTVHFMGMNPHVGQNLQLAVIEKTSGMELQRVSVTAAIDFMVDVFGIENGKSYNVDFFADHNKNGQYDAPPADHAWRMELNNVMGDTTLMFQHNTSFTDINWIATAVSELNNSLLRIYPNPASDRVFIEMDKISASEIQVSIYDITGKLRYETLKPLTNRIELDIQSLSNGIYLIDLKTNSKHQIFKLIKY